MYRLSTHRMRLLNLIKRENNNPEIIKKHTKSHKNTIHNEK